MKQDANKPERLSIQVAPEIADQLRKYQAKISKENGVKISLSQTGAALLYRALQKES